MISTNNPNGFPPRRQPLLRRLLPTDPAATNPASLDDLARFSTAMPLLASGRPMAENNFFDFTLSVMAGER